MRQGRDELAKLGPGEADAVREFETMLARLR